MNPVANGIPVRRLPPELLGESREGFQTIPLGLLSQRPPAVYKLGPRDVLGIWIEGVLGEKGQPPPSSFFRPELTSLEPTIGFPVPVRENGTIKLPLVPPIRVEGLSLEEAEQTIRDTYLKAGILKAGSEKIMVVLQRPRQYHVLVIRGDSPFAQATTGGAIPAQTTGFVIGVGGGSTGSRRGMGYTLDLPAYENDVLNALARTGGFPGTEAVDEVIIYRGGAAAALGAAGALPGLPGCLPGLDPKMLAAQGEGVIRIPLRVRPGEVPPLRPEDITLETGDVVYIESREADVYYVGGLLPAGEYVLPRDVDLDVVEAITRVRGPLLSGGINPAYNINGSLIIPGFGFPSPALVTVIRKTPDLNQVAIRVDLNRALEDRRERILIQPRDLILLQERPQDAIARFFIQRFDFSFVWNIFQTSRATGTVTGAVP
jgi:protein involved in polysaccharide export with SLBB domain